MNFLSNPQFLSGLPAEMLIHAYERAYVELSNGVELSL